MDRNEQQQETMTPEQRGLKRFPNPTALIPTCEGWQELNHRAEGYAVAVREVVQPLEARIKEMEEQLDACRKELISSIVWVPLSGKRKLSEAAERVRNILNKKP